MLTSSQIKACEKLDSSFVAPGIRETDHLVMAGCKQEIF